MLLPFNSGTSPFPSKTKPMQHQHSLMVVQPPNDDIYLCDNCDAELIGLDKMKVLVMNNISFNTFLYCSHITLDQCYRNTKGYAVIKNRVAAIRGLLRRMYCAFSRKWGKINF